MAKNHICGHKDDSGSQGYHHHAHLGEIGCKEPGIDAGRDDAHYEDAYCCQHHGSFQQLNGDFGSQLIVCQVANLRKLHHGDALPDHLRGFRHL